MIERILFKQDMAYSMVIGGIIICLTIGYFLGKQDPAVVCADYILEVEDLKAKKTQCDTELTTCKAKKAGKAALSCDPVCNKRVKAALETHKEWVCND